jgi:hypothetical protein
MIERIGIASVFIFASWFIFTVNSVGGEVAASKSRAKSDVVKHPSGCIAVYQERSGLVRFEVYFVDSSTRRLVPIEAHRISIEVLGMQPPVWEAASEDYSTAHKVTYGVAPKGFQDRIPPEQLLPGITYRVAARSFAVGGIQRIFIHEGTERRNDCPWDGNPQS